MLKQACPEPVEGFSMTIRGIHQHRPDRSVGYLVVLTREKTLEKNAVLQPPIYGLPCQMEHKQNRFASKALAGGSASPEASKRSEAALRSRSDANGRPTGRAASPIDVTGQSSRDALPSRPANPAPAPAPPDFAEPRRSSGVSVAQEDGFFAPGKRKLRKLPFS